MLKRLLQAMCVLVLLCLAVGAHSEELDQPWWQGRVFYEIFVRSFYDSDGDGIGDLQGVIEKLDYLNDGDPDTTDDLGISGIWLMPVAESPTYHGYHVTDYRTIARDYGTNDDFKQLMAEAHKRGIRVIVDLVINHAARQHEWFIASKNRDPKYESWFVWADENPGFRGPAGETVWHPLDRRYYYGVFSSEIPDLNLQNPEVTAEMIDIAHYWLDEMGADGFRLDAIKHLIENGRIQENSNETHAWLKQFNQAIKSRSPEAFLLGEAWTSTPQAVKYVDNEMDMVFEFDLALAMLRTASFGTVSTIRTAQLKVLETYPPGSYATFLTNHDQNRVMEVLGGDVGKAKTAASILLTSPGVPFIYYGEEIGMFGKKPDPDIRTPMQWDSDQKNAGFSDSSSLWRALNPSYKTVSVAAQTNNPDSLLSHYRNLIAARNRYPALVIGDMRIVSSSSRKIYSFLRYTQDQAVLVVINTDDKPAENFTLSLEEGPLAGALSPVIVFGEGTAAALQSGESGGFEAYAPADMIPAHGALIILLR